MTKKNSGESKFFIFLHCAVRPHFNHSRVWQFLGKNATSIPFFLPIFCLYPVAMSNVLFSPRAKHEIGHFSWQRHLRQKGKNHVLRIEDRRLRSSYLKEISFDLLHFPRLKHIKFLKIRTRTLWRSINQLNIEEAIFQLAFGTKKMASRFFRLRSLFF